MYTYTSVQIFTAEFVVFWLHTKKNLTKIGSLKYTYLDLHICLLSLKNKVFELDCTHLQACKFSLRFIASKRWKENVHTLREQ
jgi:hypothetical protein